MHQRASFFNACVFLQSIWTILWILSGTLMLAVCDEWCSFVDIHFDGLAITTGVWGLMTIWWSVVHMEQYNTKKHRGYCFVFSLFVLSACTIFWLFSGYWTYRDCKSNMTIWCLYDFCWVYPAYLILLSILWGAFVLWRVVRNIVIEKRQRRTCQA